MSPALARQTPDDALTTEIPPVAPGPTSDVDPVRGVSGQPGRASQRRSAAGPAAIRGARSEIRRQLREKKRLRLTTLVVVSLLFLGALPAYFGVRAASRDPVFAALDSLDLPAGMTGAPDDQISGNRWCLKECRFRQRRAQSEQGPQVTFAGYESSLAEQGWQRWRIAACAGRVVPSGEYFSCWRRDEYTLDLSVRPPRCATPGVTGPPPECPGAAVDLKIRNAMADDRQRRLPAQDPQQTGEDPDPALGGLPTSGATGAPS
ncbi:hypothetical protein [Pilimelia columellifera]|uniref:Uncharacterized protein n=1 Tax=Pilimelia columellifera subsp. columellifera TaxID=706583 RepID=A0ABP6AY57_9ACTN